ncbi:MAG: peptidase S10, partial [Mesorhizobium sp.]
MPIKLQEIALALLLLVAGAGVGHAETAQRPPPTGGALSLLPPPQTSDHSIVIAGQTLDYEAKAGTLSLPSGKGDITAEIFYVAYALHPVKDMGPDPRRPITFVFNGGPGAASAYLHLGALGPRVLATAA